MTVQGPGNVEIVFAHVSAPGSLQQFTVENLYREKE